QREGQDQGREEETRATDTIRPATHGAPPAAEEHQIPGKLHPCPSAARLSGPLPDPWLCAPASRRVCLFSGRALRCKTERLHGGCQGAIPSGQGPQYLEIAGAQEGA